MNNKARVFLQLHPPLVAALQLQRTKCTRTGREPADWRSAMKLHGRRLICGPLSRCAVLQWLRRMMLPCILCHWSFWGHKCLQFWSKWVLVLHVHLRYVPIAELLNAVDGTWSSDRTLTGMELHLLLAACILFGRVMMTHQYHSMFPPPPVFSLSLSRKEYHSYCIWHIDVIFQKWSNLSNEIQVWNILILIHVIHKRSKFAQKNSLIKNNNTLIFTFLLFCVFL